MDSIDLAFSLRIDRSLSEHSHYSHSLDELGDDFGEGEACCCFFRRLFVGRMAHVAALCLSPLDQLLGPHSVRTIS